MKTVYKDPLYSFIINDDHSVLIFEWEETSANMTDGDFKKAFSYFANYAFKFKGPGLLVDKMKLHHSIGAEAMEWRNEVCVHRYLLAGSSKLAYVMPTQALVSLPKGDINIVQFKNRYFDSRVVAIQWLLD